MDYKPKNNTITLKLDELLKNSVSPETIAKEVQAAAAEYYAEETEKQKKQAEYDNNLAIAKENAIFALLDWYQAVKDRDLDDDEYDKIWEQVNKVLDDRSSIVKIRNYKTNSNRFYDDLLDALISALY